MIGPAPDGHWTPLDGHWTPLDAPNQSPSFAHLRSGQRYRVARAFADYDGDAHPVGETWTFLGVSHAPYDSGVSLFVSLDGVRDWHIRMRWEPEDQQATLDAIGDVIEAV